MKGDAALAFAEASRAVREIKALLEQRASADPDERSQEVVPRQAKKAATVAPPPDADEPTAKGRVRCPHCLDRVRVRYGQTKEDALDEHGTDRPMCRRAIRELVPA